jgi:hypothetical protein
MKNKTKPLKMKYFGKPLPNEIENIPTFFLEGLNYIEKSGF